MPDWMPRDWALLLGAATLSVAMVTAFSAGDTGARTVTASVVTDGTAYLALAANGASPHKGFVSVSAGKVTVAFGSGVATGTGVNVESDYMFDSIIKVYNNGTTSVALDVTIGGTDAAMCQVALTSAATQATVDYSSDPTPVSRTVGQAAFLGLRVSPDSSKATSSTVSCTITVTASR